MPQYKFSAKGRMSMRMKKVESCEKPKVLSKSGDFEDSLVSLNTEVWVESQNYYPTIPN
jgi:hypothetical protein